MSSPRRWFSFLILATSVAACSGNKGSSPVAPTPTPTPTPGTVPAAPASLTVTAVSFKDRTVTINWPPAPSATSYEVRLGRFRNGQDLGVSSTQEPAITLRDVPISQMTTRPFLDVAEWVTVVSKNGSATSVSGPIVPLVMADFKAIVDVLFFSHGDYIGFTRTIPETDTMFGWPQGSNIRVRVSSSVPASSVASMRAVADQVNDATGGALRVSLEEAGASLDAAALAQQFQPGQVIIGLQPDDVITNVCYQGRVTGQPGGCTFYQFGAYGVIRAITAIFSTTDNPQPAPHELVHALLGVAHLAISPPVGVGYTFPWFQYPIMGLGINGIGSGFVAGQFAPYELEAIRSVYSAGLRAGNTRGDFIGRGLVNP